MEGKKVLVTGGSGFIGKNLIDYLTKRGNQVITLSHNNKIAGAKNIPVDFTKTDFSFLKEIDFDYVVHLAAFSSPSRCKNREEAIQLNIDATRNFLDNLSEKKGLKKIVFFSSCLVYGKSEAPLSENSPLQTNPQDTYTFTKIEGEKIVETSGLPYIIFRLSNSYGLGQQWREDATLIPQLISQAIREEKISLYDPSPIRDYIYVEDVVEAIDLALETSFQGILNLGTGIGTSAGEIAEIISKLTDARIEDIGIKNKGSKKIVLNIKKIEETLNWFPRTTVKKGIIKTIKYYQKVVEK